MINTKLADRQLNEEPRKDKRDDAYLRGLYDEVGFSLLSYNRCFFDASMTMFVSRTMPFFLVAVALILYPIVTFIGLVLLLIMPQGSLRLDPLILQAPRIASLFAANRGQIPCDWLKQDEGMLREEDLLFKRLRDILRYYEGKDIEYAMRDVEWKIKLLIVDSMRVDPMLANRDEPPLAKSK